MRKNIVENLPAFSLQRFSQISDSYHRAASLLVEKSQKNGVRGRNGADGGRYR